MLRPAALYVGAVWALAQGISQLTPAVGLPDAATRWFLVAAVIGFPFWVAFQWFYAFTPQGIKRESEIGPQGAITHSAARRLDFAIIAVLAVAVVLLGSGYFIRRGVPAATSASAFNPPSNTLVVLPFTNLGGNPQQRYFSDGNTEELTNALGQQTGLHVIAWDTASRFRASTKPVATIARELDVANVLSGKVLRQGNAIRVIVELVNARTGYQTWASHYDDSLANIFQVQDKISAAIAAALKVKFARTTASPTVNPEAYTLTLKANALMSKSLDDTSVVEQAHKLAGQAVALDPGYADAHAVLASTWIALAQVSYQSPQHALAKARAQARLALTLDPHSGGAMLLLATIDLANGDTAAAKAGLEQVLAINPSNASAHYVYGLLLPPSQALAQLQAAVKLSPDYAAAQANLTSLYVELGDYPHALAQARVLVKLTPHSATSALLLAAIYTRLGRGEDAVKAFDQIKPTTPLDKAIVTAGRLAYQSVLDPQLHTRAVAAVNALRARSDLGTASLGAVVQLLVVVKQKDAALAALSKLCARLPLACESGRLERSRLFRPLHGEPQFKALVKEYDTASRTPASAAASAQSTP